MSSYIESGLNVISDGEIDYLDDDISVVLLEDFPVDSGTVSTDFSTLSDITSYVIGSPVSLSNKDRSLGVHRADPAVFVAVPGVDVINAVGIFNADSGQLIGFASRKADTTPIEIETNGDDITVIFSGRIVYTI